jgi:hypothetical protein
MKAMRFGSGQGANRSDAWWHREDLQRSHGPKGALSLAAISGTGHQLCLQRRPELDGLMP